jgi:predicted MPP superfamily phosphohydrolase
MTRSRKLWALGLALGAIFTGLGLWAFYLEPSSLVTRRVTLQIPGWPQEQRGLRIAVLADLHVGSPYWGTEKLKLVVARTNEERPDLVVLLGDYVIQGVVGGRFVAPERIAEGLKDLRAPLGVVAVLGNHDWNLDGVRVTRALQKVGIVVLENQAWQISNKGYSFWIGGIADAMTRVPKIPETLQQVNDPSPVILIAHNPDIFPEVPGRVNLTIAGHTHGGQVDLPLVGRLIVPSDYGQRFAYGHIVEEGRHLFVSSGIGTSIIPVRFRVPPEIVILTLEPE